MAEYLPHMSGLQFLTDALGEIPVGSIIGLAGTYGSCKSILSNQMALGLARLGQRSLIVTTEQTAADIHSRMQLMTQRWPQRDVAAAVGRICIEQSLYDVRLLSTLLMNEVLSPAGRYHGARFLVLDSIQGHGLPAAAIHAYRKVLEAATLAKQNGITTVLISHTVKRGDIAGPNLLGHGLDALIMMRPAMRLKFLNVTKNRNGPVSTRPTALTIAPLALQLVPAPHAKPSPAAAKSFGGVGSGVVEVQASVTLPSVIGGGKLTAPGLPRKEIEQLIECASQVRGLDMSDLSYSIQCRLPGRMQYLCHFGLPLAMALIGSFVRHPVPKDALFLGEIDLFRRVLDLPVDLLQALCQAIEADEIKTPVTLYVPSSAIAHLPRSNGRVRVEPCETLESVISKTWPDLGTD